MPFEMKDGTIAYMPHERLPKELSGSIRKYEGRCEVYELGQFNGPKLDMIKDRSTMYPSLYIFGIFADRTICYQMGERYPY